MVFTTTKLTENRNDSYDVTTQFLRIIIKPLGNMNFQQWSVMRTIMHFGKN